MFPIENTSSTPSLTDKINKVSLEECETGRGSNEATAGSEAGSTAGDFHMAEEHFKQQHAQRNSLMPNFLEMDDELLDKMATRHQKKELRQLECDTNHDNCTDRLIKGVRPGDFMKTFEKLSWVNKVKTQHECATFLADLERWMTRMSEADRCQTFTPDSVRQHVSTSELTV
jgi:hypothetical protein